MSDPRSTYPQAKAWTFLLDTPDTTSSSAAVGRAPSAVATGARRPCLVAAGETVSRHEKKSSLGGNCGGSDPAAGSGVANGGNGTEAGEMGAMCSKSTNVANKENMGDLEEVMMFPNGDSDSSRSVSVNADCCEGNDKGMRDSSETLETPDGDDAAADAADCCKSDLPDEGAMLASMLESTTPISPIDLEEQLVRGSAASPVADGIIATGSGGISSNDMRPEDRWAWVTDNLKMLPTGANAVEIDQLKQLPGLEHCIHELLSERARHLAAMETLANQLRRREAEATKASHDLKALTARLECGEQDMSSLERRARAAAEEHRVERARWFVNKQELETRCVQLESRDTQYRASLRKKEAEYGRLQDSLRRTAEKTSSIISRGAGKGGAKGSARRGIDSNLELSPGEATTDGGAKPLGGVLNEQALWKVEELETENSGLRNMLVDLQAEVMDLKAYHDRHGDLVSAERASNEGEGVWARGMSFDTLPDEVIEGMPAGWLERHFGEETARQIKGMRGALARVVGDGQEGTGDNPMSQEDLASVVAQLRQARSLLREQDAIIFAAIFDKPGAGIETEGRQRSACGAECAGVGGSGVWDSLERLEREREELQKERSKLENDKARFLEEAVRRDSKSFVFSCPPGTPAPATHAQMDARYATPSHARSQQPGGMGALSVATASPGSQNPKGGHAAGLPYLSFTPPTASPDTAKLLGELGIRP